MAQTKGNLRMMDTGSISPLDFGAVGNGTTNDATALQNTFNASEYSIIDLCGKTYATESTITLTRSNVTIRNGTIKYTGTALSGVELIHAYGTTSSPSSTINPSANVFMNTNYISLSATDLAEFSVGEYIILSGTDDIYDSSINSYKKVERAKIRKIDSTAGSEKLILESPLELNFVAANCSITKMNPIENVVFDGITLEGKPVLDLDLPTNPLAVTNTSTTVTVTLPGTPLGITEDGEIQLGGMSADSDAPLIPSAKNKFDYNGYNVNSVSEGGGNTTITITISEAATGTNSTTGGSGLKAWYGDNQSISLVKAVNCKIIGCTFLNAGQGIYLDTTIDTLIENNTIGSFLLSNDGNGINVIRSQNLQIKGNRIKGLVRNGIKIRSSYTSQKVTIDSNIIEGAYKGIYTGDVFGCRILNNEITCLGDVTQATKNSIGILDYNPYLVCRNNIIRNFGATGIHWQPTVYIPSAATSLSPQGAPIDASNSLHQRDQLGHSTPNAWAQITDNRLTGIVGDTFGEAIGIKIRNRTKASTNHGRSKGLMILGNSIADVNLAVQFEQITTPSDVCDTSQHAIISHNYLQTYTHTEQNIGKSLFLKGEDGVHYLLDSVMMGNAMTQWNPNTTTSVCQVEPHIYMSDGSTKHGKMERTAFIGNTFKQGSYGINPHSTEVPLRDGTLLGNIFTSLVSQTDAKQAYNFNAVSNGHPIGACRGSNTPASDVAPQNMGNGLLNNFYGTSYTGS
jgi:parallel beta-helix repeat protein